MFHRSWRNFSIQEHLNTLEWRILNQISYNTSPGLQKVFHSRALKAGLVRSKIGLFENWICESRRPAFYPNKIRQKLAEIWGVQYNLLKTLFLSDFGWAEEPSKACYTKYVTKKSTNQIRQIATCRPIGTWWFLRTQLKNMSKWYRVPNSNVYARVLNLALFLQ